MATDQIWQELMKLSIICGMNQRYYQFKLSGAETWAWIIDSIVLVLTIITLMAAMGDFFEPERRLRIPLGRGRRCAPKLRSLALLFAGLSAAAGVFLIAMPTSASVRFYGTMYQSWSDLRIQIDSAVVDANAEDAPPGGQQYIERRYRDLLEQKNAINAREVGHHIDHALLRECQATEQRVQGSTLSSKQAEKPAQTTDARAVASPSS